MLVLTRKKLESLMIGDNIKVTVARIEGNRVTIGIDAPPELKVLREELIDDTNGAVKP